MIRPWQVWLVFLVCVAAAGVGMARVTRQALRADELRQTAEAKSELEQRVSLALWRMDTALAPLVAEEVIRPPGAYRPPIIAPQIDAPRQESAVAQQSPVQQQVPAQQQAPAQMPAPQATTPMPAGQPPLLLTSPPPYVVLHFEARPDGSWISPQVPLTGPTPSVLGVSADIIKKRKSELRRLAQAVKLPQLLGALPEPPAPSTKPVERQQAAGATTPAAEPFAGENPFSEIDETPQFFQGNTANAKSSTSVDTPRQYDRNNGNQLGKVAKVSKEADFQQRGERYQTATKQSFMNLRSMNAPANLDSMNPSDVGVIEEQVGVSRPMWIADRLILARRVGDNGETVVQGCWLNWPRLKKRLLEEATDLLPGADLVPVDSDAADDPSRMLAGLPVRLVLNEPPAAGAVNTTLGWALWMGWGAVALAVLAAAALLHGVMTLSERRAAFVSSVTHELRTPLTTFRMYAEMLARGMVPDAARRQEYFNTLQREAERLTLLVENVLAYARLERGRKPQRQDRITLKALLERVGPRLVHRAAQAEMKCDLQLEVHAAELEFTTDQSIVEQILFNLVDNAAKYAREADDRHIHVTASRNGEWITLAVRDHGPGIEQRPWGRAPRAFGKSAQQSAETGPGVGLGLALCRRLARQLGGRLEIDGTNGGGTIVALLLPVT